MVALANTTEGKSQIAYDDAGVDAADFIIAHTTASEAEMIAVATRAARRDADPSAKTTGELHLMPEAGSPSGRPMAFPRSTPAELAADDAGVHDHAL